MLERMRRNEASRALGGSQKHHPSKETHIALDCTWEPMEKRKSGLKTLRLPKFGLGTVHFASFFVGEASLRVRKKPLTELQGQ